MLIEVTYFFFFLLLCNSTHSSRTLALGLLHSKAISKTIKFNLWSQQCGSLLCTLYMSDKHESIFAKVIADKAHIYLTLSFHICVKSSRPDSLSLISWIRIQTIELSYRNGIEDRKIRPGTSRYTFAWTNSWHFSFLIS